MSGPIQLRRNYLKHCTNNKIEDPSDMVAATMKNLAPLIIIFQYYQAYKPLIVRWGGPPDLWNHSQNFGGTIFPGSALKVKTKNHVSVL